ncbi:ubiquitin carboxyl-terminal hydrolase 47 isoform X4 [Schistocerca gregaria]|uniref:ubiquitin carboxyl-terminal hydrolase 47 isoform X4 n=2 Tax=Schistocerca gregaria TaxID=7010 RepID=UPI00211EFE18|nr:ubiquitin carboxyl-terminal hydrolase 47 isoform X4 [Schistocerca gregaria]XP_049864802.1 ubiquitin carboxyl-terminal hydrolase 47 isoform X4 [Schistocerca gregaria]
MCLQGMVCMLEERNAICTVRDVTTLASQGSQHKITLLLPASTTVQELFQKLADAYQYDPNTFELVLQRSSEPVVLNNHKEETIEEVGVNFEPGYNNSLIVTEMRGQQTRKMAVASGDGGEDEMMLGASASPTAVSDFSQTPPAPLPPPVVSGDYYGSVMIKHDTVEYVGLVNQAMTCYLNSLLQALYMTPEFRNALYKWEYDDSEKDEAKSIPYQLQKLFLNLQTSKKSAVETTELTRSFGWDSSDSWQQHDIQELCRVMFDALEQKFKNTDQADLISRLYEGKMIDYVKCLECGTEKSREDTFLDIPLPVRPFGTAVAYSSVEEALRAFVQHETLDGNNQYFCEKCDKKCDAHKGLKFSKFPYLLTLHLKRFDFDYTALHRIKLNDKVTFPEVLNLNSFIISDEIKEENEGITEDLVVKCDDSSTTDSGSALDDESCQGTEAGLSSHDNEFQEDDEGIDMGSCANHHENEKNRRHTHEKGPYVYELFSIMIHSGSASGGHYYAYIKDFKKNEWFCFNDQIVTRITQDDITKTYGGGPSRGYYSGAYSSSTNAYMLMYRQIDKQRNSEAMTVEQFPPHIQKLLEKIQEREEFDRKRRERELEDYKLKFYAYHPINHKLLDDKVYCTSKTTVRQATELAHKALSLQGLVPLERCRLVNYDRTQETIECSFEGQEDKALCEVLDLRGGRRYDLLLQHRKEDEEFEIYQPGGVTFKVFLINMNAHSTEDVEGPFTVRGNIYHTVGEFKATAAKVLNLNVQKMYILQEKSNSHPQYLCSDDATLQSEGLHNTNKIFVAVSSGDDAEKPHFSSRLFEIIKEILDTFEYVITLNVVVPEIDKEVLRKLAIPPLNLDMNHNDSNSTHEENKGSDDSVSGLTVVPSLPPGGIQSAALLPGTAEAAIRPPLVQAQPPIVPLPAARDNSPQPPLDPEDEGIGSTGHSDQSASEDSSLTDSDRTLVGDVPDECLAHNISTPSNGSDQQNVSSPEEGNTSNYNSYTKEHSGNWDADDSDTPGFMGRSSNYYFKNIQSADSDSKRTLKFLVDKRMFLSTLKKNLEPYVGVPQEYFKINRVRTSQQEQECSRLSENLKSFRDDEKLIIKLEGEFRGKVHLLCPNNTVETSKFLCEWIIGKGMTVGEAKKEILEEVKKKHDLDIPFDRCRLRKKTWKTPKKVYLNHQQFEDDDLKLFANWEMFLQELPGPEVVTSVNQLILFVRRWCPSTYELMPFEEIVLDNNNITDTEIKKKLAELSGIPQENIEYAKVQTHFPAEISVLAIQKDLEWNAQSPQDSWHLNMLEDGEILFYRDKTEPVKELSNEERKEIANREGSRVNKLGSVSSYSPRKERALKIYVDSSPKKRDDVDELD